MGPGRAGSQRLFVNPEELVAQRPTSGDRIIDNRLTKRRQHLVFGSAGWFGARLEMMANAGQFVRFVDVVGRFAHDVGPTDRTKASWPENVTTTHSLSHRRVSQPDPVPEAAPEKPSGRNFALAPVLQG